MNSSIVGELNIRQTIVHNRELYSIRENRYSVVHVNILTLIFACHTLQCILIIKLICLKSLNKLFIVTRII